MGSQEFPGQITTELDEKKPDLHAADGKWRISGRKRGEADGGNLLRLAGVGLVMTRLPGSGPGGWPRAQQFAARGSFSLWLATIATSFSGRHSGHCANCVDSNYMNAVERKRRQDELLKLRVSDPLRIIDLY